MIVQLGYPSRGRWLGVAVLAAVACAEPPPTGPAITEPEWQTMPCPSSCLVITGMEDGRTAAIDPTASWLSYRPGSTLPVSTVAAAGGTTYFQAERHDQDTRVSEFDLRTGRIRSTFALGPPLSGPNSVGVYLLNIAMSADRRLAFTLLADFWSNTEILRLPTDGGGAQSGSRIFTDGPIQVARGRGPLDAGTVVVVGARRAGPQFVYLLDTLLAIRDSVCLCGFDGSETRGLPDMELSPDELHLYAILPPHLIRVDLAARRISAVADTPRGLVSVSGDGRRVFVTDPGGWYELGSSVIHEYTSDLTSHREIDLAQGASGQATEVHQVIVARDGITAYALSGRRTIEGFASGEGVVHTLDLQRGVVTRRFPLGVGVGVASMYLIEPGG